MTGKLRIVRGVVSLGLILAMGCATNDRESPPGSTADRAAIEQVFDGLTAAWEASDGNAWGSHFVDDADFTVWFGLLLEGREAIAGGHQWVFETVYPNSRYEFEQSSSRERSGSSMTTSRSSISQRVSSLTEARHPRILTRCPSRFSGRKMVSGKSACSRT